MNMKIEKDAFLRFASFSIELSALPWNISRQQQTPLNGLPLMVFFLLSGKEQKNGN